MINRSLKEQYTFEIIDHTGVLRLGPPPGNELSSPEFVPLEIFRSWSGNEDIKGIIVTGMGKNFSSGGALTAVLREMDDKSRCDDIQKGKTLLRELMQCEIPVIAAVNRICFGGGLEIALACHIRVASENALFAFPEVNHAIMPGLGGTVNLPVLVGFGHAAATILAGDMINAGQALELGMIDFLAPQDGALDFAMNLMHKMTQDRPRRVISAIMQALHHASNEPLEKAMEKETRLFCELVGQARNSNKPNSTGI